MFMIILRFEVTEGMKEMNSKKKKNCGYAKKKKII